MIIVAADRLRKVVALRKESVDRNWNLVDQAPEHRGSLSARRAWIEIDGSQQHQ